MNRMNRITDLLAEHIGLSSSLSAGGVETVELDTVAGEGCSELTC